MFPRDRIVGDGILDEIVLFLHGQHADRTHRPIARRSSRTDAAGAISRRADCAHARHPRQ